MRASAIPSAAANVLSGFLIAHRSWTPTSDLLLLLVVTCCLYASGMVLNDLCDVQNDREIAPSRPLPAGQISSSSARWFYLTLTGLGLMAAAIVGMMSLLIAACVAVAIVMYDFILKKTVLAPIAMGACRFLNVLLGGSTYCQTASGEILGWPVSLLWFATSLSIVIVGITLLAKNENNPISRSHLNYSAGVIIAGLAGFIAAPFFCGELNWTSAVYALIIIAIGTPPLMKTLRAIKQFDGKQVRMAVIAFLQSLIFLDAAACFLVTANLIYPVVVLLLIVPAKFLARTISPT